MTEGKALVEARAEATLEGLKYVSSDELLVMTRGLPAVEEAMSMRNGAGRSVGLGPKGAVELICRLALWEDKDAQA